MPTVPPSFGRPEPVEPEPDAAVVPPGFALVTVMPVIDETALQAAMDRLREATCTAFTEGIRDAMNAMEVGLDLQPEPNTT